MNNNVTVALAGAAGLAVGFIWGATSYAVHVQQRENENVKKIALLSDDERNQLLDEMLTDVRFKMITDEF